MKKNKKIIIIVLGVIALLSAALAVAFMLPSNKQITDNDNETMTLYKKDDLMPESISVKNDSGEYELLGFFFNQPSYASDSSAEGEEESSHSMSDGTDIVYTMQDHPGYKLDKEITDKLVSQCKKLYAKEIVDKSGNRYEEYGLDEPKGSYSVRYSDASEVKIDIGSFAPDDKGIYVRVGGDENVYLVESYELSPFFIDKLQLFDKNMTGSIDEVLGFTISGEGYKEDIVVTENIYACYEAMYIIENPSRVACDNYVTKTVYGGVQSLKGDSVAAIDVTSEELAKYGLDKPFEKVSVRGKGGQSINVLTSETDDDGKFYIMNEGSNIIYTLSQSDNSWHGITKFDLLHDSVFSVLPGEVRQLDTTVDSDKKTYTIEREKYMGPNYYENESITVKCGDKEIPYTNITVFIYDLAKLNRTNELPDDTSGFKTNLMELNFKYYNYPELSDNVKLLRNGAGKTLIVINGKPECCVNTEKADQIISQAKLIYTSERMKSVFGE